MKSSRTWLIVAILAIAATTLYFVSSERQKDDQLKFVRNKWASYLYIGDINYKYSKLGGVDAFDIPIRNSTDYLLDEVVVSVEYIKAAGGVFKTEKVTVTNIQPHSTKLGRAPESNRGTSIDVKIESAISRPLNFCYPSGRGDYSDPYYCK